MGKICTICFICLTWIVGIIIGTPSLLYFTTVPIYETDPENETMCTMIWPDGLTTHSELEHVYVLLFRDESNVHETL